MKRIVVIVFALILTFSLSGCFNQPSASKSVSSSKGGDGGNSGNGDGSSGGNAAVSGGGSGVTPNNAYPIVKKKITLNVLVRGNSLVENFNTNAFTKWLEKKTNIHVNWDVTDEKNWQQKLNLVLASGKLPDVIMNMGVSPAQQMVYASQGLIIPLNDLIDKYAPNTQNIFKQMPEVKAAISAPGGKIYSMPYVNECYHCSMDYKMYVLQSWLKKLNLKAPTTPDEFEAMLKAFKTKDPNGNGKPDEIPLAGSTDQKSQIDVFLMNAFIYDDGDKRMIVNNGKIDVVYNKPQWKQGLKYLHKLYSEGLIAPQSFTQDKASLKKMAENPNIPILGAAPAHSPSSFTIIEGKSGRWLDYQPIKPLKGPNGLQITVWEPFDKIRQGQFMITKADKHLAATMRWADTMYTFEANLWENFGIQGKDWVWAKPGDKGRDGKPAKYEVLVPFGRVNNDSWSQYGLNFRTDQDWYRGQAITKLPNKEKMYYDVTKKNYAPYKQSLDHIVPPLFFTKDQAAQVADLETNITNYFTTMTAKFINGEADIDKDWDTYVKTLDGMGLKKYLSIYQQAYDAKMKK